MTVRERLAAPVLWLGRAIAGTLTVRVDDGPGWGMLSDRPHERTHAEIQELYEDTITAWRKNPMAKRGIDIRLRHRRWHNDQLSLLSPAALHRSVLESS